VNISSLTHTHTHNILHFFNSHKPHFFNKQTNKHTHTHTHTNKQHFSDTLQKLETGGIQQVRANEQIVWKDTLRTTFVWMDWFSIPQRGIDETSQTDIELSLRTIPAYVERADFVTIVAPACKHKDRYDRSTNKNAELSYRT